MPVYKYSAVAVDGSKRNGRLEAANETQLTSLLSQDGLFLMQSSTAEKSVRTAKLKTQEIADFCRQLAAMLSSGITLIRAMQIIAGRDTKPHIKKVYEAVISDLQRGSTLSEAMTHQGRAFPELLISMMRAGESSGRMDITATKMAEQYDKQHRLDGKIKSATTYPIILVVLIVLVMVIIFTFVLPTFFDMFKDMVLPLPTRIVLAISNFLTGHFAELIVGVVIVVFALLWLFRQPGPRRAFDHFKLRLPKIKGLLSIIYTSRFARTLSSLYVSGIPMIQALSICRSTIGNKYIDSQFDMVIGDLGNGRTLSQALVKVDGFDKKLNSTIMIGEESGRLEQMLESVADQFDYDSEMASQRLVTMLEPILIVVMAVIVAFVMISVMMPIYQMYSTVGAEA
ncbi:MAG: type II secretion system F family protein [Clostridiales Family XIII bacterium]|jgi:type IV pilus assembly protein PilC|nr:type II secretion system F family protein [Clostridiales Family XIII bacterium]